jgi:hypothetical protein
MLWREFPSGSDRDPGIYQHVATVNTAVLFQLGCPFGMSIRLIQGLGLA